MFPKDDDQDGKQFKYKKKLEFLGIYTGGKRYKGDDSSNRWRNIRG